jgi:hypothetical protein
MRFSVATENANSALVEMLDAARSAFPLMPPSMQRNHSGPITPAYLSRIARAEIARLDSRNPYEARLFHHAPWAEDLKRGGGKWATLPELVEHHVNNLKDIAGKLAMPDPEAPVPEPVAVEPAPAPIVRDTPLDKIMANSVRPSEKKPARKPVPPLDTRVNLSSHPMPEEAA